jgi:hypothetical protein
MGYCLQVNSPDGFSAFHGTGLGVVEGFLDAGEAMSDAPDSWVTPCPAGFKVDGYQVVTGALVYQIRPRCSCFNCGAPLKDPNRQSLRFIIVAET